MERNIDLERQILFVIERDYQAGQLWMFGPKVEHYSVKIVAEHCDLLYQQGLIKNYDPILGGGEILDFRIGNLTARGYDTLELIKNGEVWEKAKTEIEEKKLPRTLEVASQIAGVFLGNFMKEFTDRS